MYKVYIVEKGSEIVVRRWAFTNLEDAELCRYELDKNKGASSSSSLISILYIFESFDEIIIKEPE